MKIAVFTGTRAEYGLLYWLMKDIQSDPSLSLQLIVSGTHLSPDFGLTYRQIEKDGFKIDEKVEILLNSDSPIGVAKSVGLGVMGFGEALDRLQPDYLIILGDRFEALAAAQAALFLRVPVVHLHGGEITEGAYDDNIRHAITKLSYLHGTSTEVYRQRVIQMGEAPERVVTVGALGLDHLQRTDLMSRSELADSIEFPLQGPYFVVTYHPVTVAEEDPEQSFLAILEALDQFPDHKVILTFPNADDGGRKIIPLIRQYAEARSDRVCVSPSLGQLRYLSALKYCSAVIGNSSSGVIEVPSFHKPTINIGSRQRGRLAAASVIHCVPEQKAIVKALKKALSAEFTDILKTSVNPYGKGNASGGVIDMIKRCKPGMEKTFHDIDVLKP